MGIKFLRFLDKYIFALFNFIFFPLKYFFNNEKYIKKPKKILVIRFWALGSSILTFPMILDLKKHYGYDVEYTILATSRTIGIYKNQGYFDKYLNLLKVGDLIKLIFSFKKYDIVIDTEDYFNISSLVSLWIGKINIGYSDILSRKIVYNNPIKYNDKIHACINFLYLLKPLNIIIKEPSYLDSYKYLESDKNSVDEFLNNYENYKKICFHTGGAETNNDRFWDIKNWIDLIDKLSGKNIVIFLSGTKFEEKIVLKILSQISNKNVVNICNKFNLKQFAYFLEKCDLTVSNDTGPMHLSASMKTKTIGLFGPNLPSRFGAYPIDKNINIYKGDFKPTINVHLGSFEVDKNNFVNNITVGEVFEIIKKEIN